MNTAKLKPDNMNKKKTGCVRCRESKNNTKLWMSMERLINKRMWRNLSEFVRVQSNLRTGWKDSTMKSWWGWIKREKIPNEHFEEIKSSAKHFSKCKEKWKGDRDIWEDEQRQRESQKCAGLREIEIFKGFEA